MRLLMISTDRALFDETSPVRARIMQQSELVEHLSVIVLTPKGERYIPVQVSPRLSIIPTASSSKWAYLPDAFMLGRAILRGNASEWLITTQDPFETGALGYALSVVTKAPLHLQIHTDPWSTLWQHERLLHRIRYMLMRFLLPRADGVRVVSRRVEDSLIASGVDSERITRVPIHTDVSAFTDVHPTIDLRKSYPFYGKIVLSLGRLEHEKNFSSLIRAFARVRRVHDDALLVIAGSGSERERLLTLIRSLELDKSVVLLPWVRDVAAYYRSSDCYVQPSLYEGWGLAVIEAMASGTPVVMTDVGVAGELVRDDETGLVVPPNDEERLADAITRLLGDPARATRLAEAGKREVSKNMTKDETLELYKKSWNDAWKYGTERKAK